MFDATAIGTFVLAVVTYLTVREMQQQQKHSKLTEEMSLLVGPLYSKKNNEILFGITSAQPNRYHPDSEFRWRDYYDFWDKIITKSYLAPSYLRERLNEYLAAKNAYWSAFEDGEHGLVRSFEETPLGETKKGTFDLKRNAFQSAVDARYHSLTIEIEQAEKDFWKRLLNR